MSLISMFNNDPFFSGADFPQALALEHRSRYDNRDRQRRQNNNRDLDIFGNPFALMQNALNNMGAMMNHMGPTINSKNFSGQNGHGVSFSSSTVMSMDSRNGGQPRIIQATSEQIRGPEGLERTRKAVRDTGRNLEKMEVAHRLGQRAHKITTERDASSGQLLENREFEHIDDEDQFEREWFNRAEKLGLKNPNGNGFSSRANNLLTTPPSYEGLRSQSQGPRRLAIEQGQSIKNNSRNKERRKK